MEPQWFDGYIARVTHIGKDAVQYIFTVNEGIKVQIYEDSPQIHFLPGDKLRLKLRLKEAKQARNPGGFDETFYYFSQDIQLKADLLDFDKQASPESVRLLSLPMRLSYQLREHVSFALIRELGVKEGSVAVAVLLGSERYLDNATRQAFRAAGLAHVLVVSGGNVAVLILLFSFVLERFISRLYLRSCLLICIALVFGSICAWDASVTRAVLMYVISAGAILLKRPTTPARNLGYAVLLMFFIQERYLLRIGFLMSAVCSFAIIRYANQLSIFLLKPLLKLYARIISPNLSEKAIKTLHAFLLACSVTLTAQLAVFPFTVYLQGRIGVFQVLLNLPATILLGFITLLGLSILPLTALGSQVFLLFSPLVIPLRSALAALISLAQFGAGAPLSRTATASALLLLIPVYASTLVFSKKKFLSTITRKNLLVLSIVLCLLAKITLHYFAPDYLISFIDVGQGSAILLSTRNGQAILYDCGPASASTAIVSYCKSLGIEKINLVIISHMHEDHYGAFQSVASELAVEAIVIPNDKNLPAYKRQLEAPYLAAREELLDFCQKEKISEIEVEAGTEIVLDGMRLYFLYTASEEGSLGNAGSSLVRVALNDKNIYLLADMPARHWPLLESEMALHKADVLQFPHHGSRDGLSENQDLPHVEHVVMQLAKGNRYGHPHGSVLKSLQAQNINFYRTDLDACVEIFVRKDRWILRTFLSKKKLYLGRGN